MKHKKQKIQNMSHFTEALPEGTEVQLAVTYIDYPERREDILVTAIVTGVTDKDANGNPVLSGDGTFHYNLQATFTKDLGNNAATVQIADVHPSLIVTKED